MAVSKIFRGWRYVVWKSSAAARLAGALFAVNVTETAGLPSNPMLCIPSEALRSSALIDWGSGSSSSPEGAA
jgi:hypothetical protein